MDRRWRRSGGSGTSERGWETDEPHFRGIFDSHGRLMVLMTHNTDIADGWEREGDAWVRDGERWRLRFHQATATVEPEP